MDFVINSGGWKFASQWGVGALARYQVDRKTSW